MTTSPFQAMSRRMFVMAGGSSVLSLAACGADPVPMPETSTMPPVVTPPQNLPEVDRLNVEVVLGMSTAWQTGDVNEIARFLHEEIAFRGAAEQMTPAVVGKAAFIESVAQFLSTTSVEMVVRDTFALNPCVMTAHQQLFRGAALEGEHEDLYIGCFFLQDGQIREWNDYAIIPFSQPVAEDTAERARFFHVPA